MPVRFRSPAPCLSVLLVCPAGRQAGDTGSIPVTRYRKWQILLLFFILPKSYFYDKISVQKGQVSA
jgi:hypothetical protein